MPVGALHRREKTCKRRSRGPHRSATRPYGGPGVGQNHPMTSKSAPAKSAPSKSGHVLLLRGLSVAAVAGTVFLSSCGGSASTTPSPARSLPSALMAPAPPGFTSEAYASNLLTNTGALGIAEASLFLCDGASQKDLEQDHWVATELRYFDKDPAYPSTYLTLCVTKLGSASAASRIHEQKLVALSEGPAKPFSVPQITGATGDILSVKNPQIAFTKGRYFVYVVCAGASNAATEAARQPLVTDLAVTEYGLLPG